MLVRQRSNVLPIIPTRGDIPLFPPSDTSRRRASDGWTRGCGDSLSKREPKPASPGIGIGGVSMNHRLTGLALLAVIALTACGRASSTAPAAAGYRIFLEEGFNGGSERITVRDSGSGALERALPLGTPAPAWPRY